MKFTDFCINRPVFTVVLSLILIVVGIIGYMRVPVRGYPDVNMPVISVTTTYAGASASIMESQITTPIENDLAGISGLYSMHSSSMQGQSRIILDFNMGVDINAAVYDVQNRLAGITKQLPQDVDPPIIEKRDPNSLQTMVLSVSDPNMTPMAITDYASRNIVPQLEQILGVASVELYNQRAYAMKILLDPAKMAANQVTVSDLTNVLNQQNVNVPTGQIKNSSRYYSVLSQGQLSSVNAFRNLIIRDNNGYMLHFSDVANIDVGPESTDDAMRINAKPALGLGVYADSTANPIKVAALVQHELKKIQQNMPEGMEIQSVWNDTTFLKASLNDVYSDLLFAIVLVVLVVMLFLGSIRSTLIPVVTIPICLIGVCALIYIMGYSINVFTLLALVLAIGLVVDDAIVMLENIHRYIEQGLSPLQAAMKGSGEIAFAIIAMTLTLAAVYAPIGFATGMTGIIFRQFAFTLALAVVLSGFVALTLSPMMCARLLVRQGGDHKSGYTAWLERVFERLMNAYRNILDKLLRHRIWVVLVLLVVAALGYVCFTSLSSGLAPQEDMGIFFTTIDAPANASFDYTNNYAKHIEKIISDVPEVSKTMMMVNSENGGFGIIILKPWDKRSRTAQMILQKLSKKVANIPGAKVGFFNDSQIGGGGKYGDSVRVLISTYESYDQLHATVKDFLNKLRSYPGITNASQDLQMNERQYVIHVDHSLAAALQVNVSDISDTLKTMLGGSKVTNFIWDNHDYNVILQVPDQDLQQLRIIDQLYVRSQAGKMIPLSTLATIRSEVGPQQLPHDERMRSDTVTMQLANGYSMGKVVHYLQQQLKQQLPEGYQYDFRGVAKHMLESRHTMLGSFVLAVVFIYLVLAAQFESFVDPFIILLSVPLSIVGAIFTLKLTGSGLSIYTNIGFVTLVGLIAKHGILITEFANQQRMDGIMLHEAILNAASLRLRPILMTTAAMVIGAVPLAAASGAGALSRQNIGWVIVGGLFFGTFFSLVVVPIAYSYLGPLKKHFKKKL
ncbi:MAG: efflux RND transporter permease subunit [Gammaproteobacteria bacterium]|nr:efflux RND transporter permease subunit [Gammaproteobacteria bacterium]MCH9744974.1 efflux RND transporter permease subunit [Gammaproteobacteria bacterium]